MDIVNDVTYTNLLSVCRRILTSLYTDGLARDVRTAEPNQVVHDNFSASGASCSKIVSLMSSLRGQLVKCFMTL